MSEGAMWLTHTIAAKIPLIATGTWSGSLAKALHHRTDRLYA